MTTKPPTKRGKKRSIKRARSQDAEVKKHLPAVREIHPELREMVNNFLRERNLPLKVHAMHFTTDLASSDFNCCTINGMVVCGPQCG
jgi:hypothetical protein